MRIVVALLFPFTVLALLAGGGVLVGLLLAGGLIVASAWALRLILARSGAPPAPRPLPDEEQPEAIRQIMQVDSASESEGVQVFRGRLRESAAAAYERLKWAFSGRKVPVMQEDRQAGAAIVLLPAPANPAVVRPVRTWLHWLLFALTLATTTWAGALHQGVDITRQPRFFFLGFPYSLGLLAILGCHELGHYFTARARGMNVSPPYFIPVPFALGTFGAFIRMRTPAENRRALFDVAVAGPLAGLAIAIPALLLGLQTSEVIPGGARNPAGMDAFAGALLGGTPVGSSALFALLTRISLGPRLFPGDILMLSPLAFAGWLGLLVTALNLFPIGQLDGGHMAHAMFGRRIGESISNASLFLLFALAVLVWPGLLFWAFVVYLIAGRSAFLLNDITPLSPGRRWLGYATFGLLAMLLLPA